MCNWCRAFVFPRVMTMCPKIDPFFVHKYKAELSAFTGQGRFPNRVLITGLESLGFISFLRAYSHSLVSVY